MEPRAALAAYDAEQGLLTRSHRSQGALRIKSTIAACLGLPPERVRVVTGDVGGGVRTAQQRLSRAGDGRVRGAAISAGR